MDEKKNVIRIGGFTKMIDQVYDKNVSLSKSDGYSNQ